MASSLSFVLRDPPIRTAAMALFFFGSTSAATAPYQSIVGIQELGLSSAVYSLLIFAAAVINVSASLLFGILSDRLGRFRPLVMILSVFGVVGYGLIFAFPTAWVFIASILLLIPVFNALNSVLFGSVRARTNAMGSRATASVNSTVRAILSASWILIPGIVAITLAGSASMLPAYLLASLCGVICFLMFLLFTRDAPLPNDASRLRPAYLSSLAEVAKPRVSIRIVAVSLVTAMLHVNGAVAPLIITGQAGGNVRDVGFNVGAVAFLEIIFIVFWGLAQRRLKSIHILAAGTTLYALYLVLLGFATAPWHVYALLLINGAGAAAIISIPITYLQDLLADRPGLGSSLISVNMFLSGGLSALLFGAGAAIGGYSGAVILGGLSGLGGVLLLLALDKRDARAAPVPA